MAQESTMSFGLQFLNELFKFELIEMGHVLMTSEPHPTSKIKLEL